MRKPLIDLNANPDANFESYEKAGTDAILQIPHIDTFGNKAILSYSEMMKYYQCLVRFVVQKYGTRIFMFQLAIGLLAKIFPIFDRIYLYFLNPLIVVKSFLLNLSGRVLSEQAIFLKDDPNFQQSLYLFGGSHTMRDLVWESVNAEIPAFFLAFLNIGIGWVFWCFIAVCLLSTRKGFFGGVINPRKMRWHYLNATGGFTRLRDEIAKGNDDLLIR